jgi:hypothetical protein
MKKIAAVIAILSLSLASNAASAAAKHKHLVKRGEANNYELSKRTPQVRGYLFRPGGHSYDYENEPFLRRNGPYGNFPDFDPRNFWERVQGDPRTNATSPSSF